MARAIQEGTNTSNNRGNLQVAPATPPNTPRMPQGQFTTMVRQFDLQSAQNRAARRQEIRVQQAALHQQRLPFRMAIATNLFPHS